MANEGVYAWRVALVLAPLKVVVQCSNIFTAKALDNQNHYVLLGCVNMFGAIVKRGIDGL